MAAPATETTYSTSLTSLAGSIRFWPGKRTGLARALEGLRKRESRSTRTELRRLRRTCEPSLEVDRWLFPDDCISSQSPLQAPKTTERRTTPHILGDGDGPISAE
uniref:Uncharacterized protein n=1 Tax=Plectus sambesii TaxID=2011161 RepID=A0A914XJD9_9BILA